MYIYGALMFYFIFHGVDPANINANAKKQFGYEDFNTEEINVK